MKIYNLIIKSLICIFLVLVIARVVVSNVISTSGVELGKINDEIANYKLENDSLSEKIFSMSSLSTIASEAAKLGFVDEGQNFVLTNPLPIALRQ